MNLPTQQEIEELWKEFAVPSNVKAHMKKVAEVAVIIAKKFNEAGIDVNVELVEKAPEVVIRSIIILAGAGLIWKAKNL